MRGSIKKLSLWLIFVCSLMELQAQGLLLERETPKKEIRAVWLTTIYGLDWPSRPALTPAGVLAQQHELCTILDRLQEARFNMVFLQVRLRGDVIWPSGIEPAAKVLAGKYGLQPGYDPLRFAVEECHKRGMECHAWMVTFPVGTDKVVREQGPLSVVQRRPELCKQYNGEWYLDPGVPATGDYILALVKEVVNGYDIDGIHFDYIRYPDNAARFPDKKLHNRYGKSKQIADWRRKNIDNLMATLYDWIKQAKPWVQVSSAPLGKYTHVARGRNTGRTAYESVYQDPKRWMEEGKHDMIVPMMYYLHDDFFPFVDNWVDNSGGRLVVPGLGAYRTDDKEAGWSINDITDQIDYSRHYGAAGCAFFRAANVLDNSKGLYDELKNRYYRYPAMLPPLSWLCDSVPHAPGEIWVERAGKELSLRWEKPVGEQDSLTYTVYYSLSDSIRQEAAADMLATGIHGTTFSLPVPQDTERGYTFSVSASNRYRIEGRLSKETYYYLSEFEK